MRRYKIKSLESWSQDKQRKPLLLSGVRQCGKSYLVREFGKSFTNFHEFNFQKNPELATIFEQTSEPLKIIQALQIIQGKNIDLKNDLIFFDEVQDCPKALNSLKFFSEDCPDSRIIAAGSLLGIYLSQNTFPVGKVDMETLAPMNFDEFLLARGKTQLLDFLQATENNIPEYIHKILTDELSLYYIVGGMPEAVSIFIESEDLLKVRKRQTELLKNYMADFAKYSNANTALQLVSTFESIPRQLAKDNSKFKFNLIKTNGRYNEFKSSIHWLVHSGIAHKVPIISSGEIPLKMHINENSFKLYFCDVGLLGALADLPLNSFLNPNDLFKTFKGAFVENLFIQEFFSHQSQKQLYCWQGRSSEVDFLFEKDGALFPIEVKSGKSGKLKSMQVFAEKYPIQIKTKASLLPLQIQKEINFQNIPLYFIKRLI
jgi:predicted AAA+ superfamily ATPase